MNIVITDAAARREYEMMQSAFEWAMEQNPHSIHESWYTFGGRSARIRVVGSEMAQHIVQPFSHVRSAPPTATTPQLSIDLWDESETGLRYQGNLRNGRAGRSKIIEKAADGQFVGQQLRNVCTRYDRETQHLISSVAWAEQVSIYDRWKPVSRPLLEWHNDQNIQMIHASLVSRNGQGVVCVGKSGSGKSTVALACLGAGFDFLGEDYVGLQRLADGSFVGHSLYNSVFLETAHLARFPSLSPYVKPALPHEEKSAIVLSHVFPERLARAAPIRALLLPRIVDAADSTACRASKGEALLTFGPSSLLKFPSRRLGIAGFNNLAQLVEQVPSYWLELGRDLESIPRCVERLLREAGGVA